MNISVEPLRDREDPNTHLLQMIDDLDIDLFTPKTAKNPLTGKEQLKSYQYQAPQESGKYLSTSSEASDRRPQLEASVEKQEIAKSRAVGSVVSVANRKLEGVEKQNPNLFLAQKMEAIDHYENQVEAAQKIEARTEVHICSLNNELNEPVRDVRARDSAQIVSTILEVQENEEQKVHSLLRLARAIIFLAEAIERLELMFKMFEEDSPLFRWMEEMGVPEEAHRPIRNVLAGMLLGANESGFQNGEFNAIIGGVQFEELLDKMKGGDKEKLSVESFEDTVHRAIADTLEYLVKELEETLEDLQMIQFILTLLILLLLVVMEKLYSLEKGEEGLEDLSLGEKLRQTLQNAPQSKAEDPKMIEVALHVVGNMVEKLEESLLLADREDLKSAKGEESEDVVLRGLKDSLSKVAVRNEETEKKLISLFANVTEAINNIFEKEDQAIKINMRDSA